MWAGRRSADAEEQDPHTGEPVSPASSRRFSVLSGGSDQPGTRCTMRVARCLSLVRPVGPVVVGISLGFTLSLLSVSLVREPCDPDPVVTPVQDDGVADEKPVSTGLEDNEDFEPRILKYESVQKPEPKKIVRAKYVSSELGIREHLFVGILTSERTLGTLAVAANRTISHHLDSVVFFTDVRGRKAPHGMFVVAHGYERYVWNLYQTIRYILYNFISEYDFFYLAQDSTYTQADRLKALVGHLSMDRLLYMGRPEEIGGQNQGRYCDGGFGYLLSRSLLLTLQPFLEDCSNNIVGKRPDEWLGRCIVQYTGTQCVEQYEDLQYVHYELENNSDPREEDNIQFINALAVHPVSDPEQMYRLHKRFSQMELQKTYEDIEKLQAEIKNISTLAFDGNRTTTWPIGINPPFEAKTRFDVLRWEYFTEDHLFSCMDGSAKCELHVMDKLDVADVIEVALTELNRKYNPVLDLKKQQLLNGYRRFDPTRGMEYILDLQLEAINQKQRARSITKRVHLLRPLSRIEIIPMPYVTEDTKVHIVLPVTFQDREQARQFLEAYATKALSPSENAALTLLFIYEPYEAEEANQDGVFAGVKAQISTYERKYPVKILWLDIKMESPSQIKLMDVISRKHQVDALFFIATVKTNISSEFLNHCRMNSLSNWQVFFPIHFQDYDPDIAYHQESLPKTIDLVKNAGLFDRSSFDEACFYNSDFMAARNNMAADVQENEDLLENLDLYEMFIRYSTFHVFRAVEPSLHRRYSHQKCDPRLSEEGYHRCVQGMLHGLGPVSKLAMLLFDLEQGNST